MLQKGIDESVLGMLFVCCCFVGCFLVLFIFCGVAARNTVWCSQAKDGAGVALQEDQHAILSHTL